MSKFHIRKFRQPELTDFSQVSILVAEPTLDAKLHIEADGELTPEDAKKLARYLNSWAGFEDAGESDFDVPGYGTRADVIAKYLTEDSR